MKTLTQRLSPILFIFIVSSINTNLYSQVIDEVREKLNKPETAIPAEIYWDVKAYSPTWGLLKVKAVDEDGNLHDIKAIQDSDDTSVLNVKALINGQRVAVKLIKKEGDRLYPVKAITQKGIILDVKAFDPDGETIDVKGFSKTGNIVNLRAIRPQAILYNIVAVSPTGNVNSVKGIKMMDEEVEAVIHGVEIFAHVKALTQN